MATVEQKGVENFSESDFSKINELMSVWLKVAKKMEFYRLDADFKKLIFNKNGIYRLYDFGNLKSIYLLSEIEKYRSLEEGTTLSELHMEEHASIFRDVSLKIGRHVLTELKKEMYLPGKELMLRVLKIYSFKYNVNISFADNYKNSLNDKQIIC